jgi:dipeptidyl aminopeptidase/acylaminoacyl peptidase
LAIATVVLALLVGTGVTAAVGSSYDLDEERITIPVAGGTLDAVLARPAGVTDDVGVVLFVHGDGPVDATSDGFYRPIWEALGRAGYASLSWSKPGVGGSTGDWLDQSLGDRADEVSAVLDWLRDRPGVDPSRTGLWGASQGGWVVPAVAATRDDIAFTILVSPAVDWLRQGRFHLLAGLDDTGASTADREAALAVSDDTRRLLDEGASYERYRSETVDPEPMDEDRWGFVLRNHTADATSDLAAMGASRVPTLLLLGEEDRNVDVDETERAYRAALGGDLTVRRFAGARHTLARAAVEDHAVWGAAVAILAPKQVFVPGYLEAQQVFLEDL